MTTGTPLQVSLTAAAVAAVAVGVGTAAGLALVPVVGSYLGMVLGGFVTGLAVEKRPLVESGVAAALASLGVLSAGALVGNGVLAAVSALGSVAPTALLSSLLLSFAVGAFGAHFGDDLREGLTSPVETPPAGRTDLEPGTIRSAGEDPPESEAAENAPAREDPTDVSTPPGEGESEGTADRSSGGGSESTAVEDLELERE